MNDLMYDGINSLAAGIARVFPGLKRVAGYVDGRYAWSGREWGLFPDPVIRVGVAVRASTNAGDVLDVETGDAIPDQAHGWIAMRKAAGLYRPTIYCSLSVVPAVRAGTGSFVLGKDYDIWVAHYTGQPHQAYPGCAATQYESTANWDASIVHDTAWPHRKPPGAPAPPPGTARWPAGVVLKLGDHGEAVTALQEALNGTHLPGVRNITVDGSFGGQTETSVRNFQGLEGLAVDGIAGKDTRAALGVK